MVASIGVIASPSQGASYFAKDGYYAKDDPAHQEASVWAGRGAAALGLCGPVDSDTFEAILEGRVPDGPHLGERGRDGEIVHRPGRDVTMSAPKSVILMAMVGGDERIVEAHDRAVRTTLSWIEKNAVLTRIQDKATGAMIHADGQKMVASTFRHDTSRNLDPQLHTHAVIANMVQGGDGKWRTMVNDGLCRNKMAIGAIYRAELAQGLNDLGYGVEKTHADGRFEIAGVPRDVIDAFSTRQAETEAAMAERGMGESKDGPHLADCAALMTRAAKHHIDREEPGRSWKRQAAALGFSASKVRAHARKAERGLLGPDLFTGPGWAAGDAAAWAVEHLAERQAALGLSRQPGPPHLREASRIHGITDRKIRNAPAFSEIAGELRAFIGTRALIGHNVQFDKRFLSAEFKRAGQKSLHRNRAYCTMRRFQAEIGRRKGSRLEDAARYFGLEARSDTEHDALEDARIALEIAIMFYAMDSMGLPAAGLVETGREEWERGTPSWTWTVIIAVISIFVLWAIVLA